MFCIIHAYGPEPVVREMFRNNSGFVHQVSTGVSIGIGLHMCRHSCELKIDMMSHSNWEVKNVYAI
jgi:hypothetical protein